MQKIQKELSTYFSDHSEDVVRFLSHNSGNFTYEMSDIPLIFWFSEEYRRKNHKVKSLEQKFK